MDFLTSVFVVGTAVAVLVPTLISLLPIGRGNRGVDNGVIRMRR